MSNHTYRLKYKLVTESGEFSKDEITRDGAGGADALVLLSCLFPPDGSYSQAVVSMDGRTGKPVSAKDLWKAWLMLAGHLAEADDLDEFRRGFADHVFHAAFARLAAIDGRPPEGTA